MILLGALHVGSRASGRASISSTCTVPSPTVTSGPPDTRRTRPSSARANAPSTRPSPDAGQTRSSDTASARPPPHASSSSSAPAPVRPSPATSIDSFTTMTRTHGKMGRAMAVHKEEAVFTVRVDLVAEFPDTYEGDEDGNAWLER